MTTAAAARSHLQSTQIPFEAPEHIHGALASLGRTEDVRLSPNGRRLAVASYALDQIAVADVTLTRTATGLDIAVTSLAHYASRSVQEPHGLDFVDDETLVIGSRCGEITVLRLPPAGTNSEPTRIGSVTSELGSPGSVATRMQGTERELLVVHNWANAITRYCFEEDGTIVGGEVVARRWLDLPDGLTISADGRWLAVSNHNTHDVFVFETAGLHADVDPVGVLRGVGYPHGLRFTHDDRLLLVADAGAPYVDVFARAGDTWAGASFPITTIRVMDDETFARGRHNEHEGGPKGIDVDPRTNVLVITSETLPVAFFDLELALEQHEVRSGNDRVGYELMRLRDIERSRASAAEAVAGLHAVVNTKAWRMTKPARAAYGRLQRLRRGR